MIIAPLSRPITGIALAAVKRQRNGSVGTVTAAGSTHANRRWLTGVSV
jgi:hypothetical protein